MQKQVKGYPYIVTDAGEIYSILGRNRKPRLKPMKMRASHRTRGRYKRKGRYIVVTLLATDGWLRRVALHRLIAEAFIDNPLLLNEIDHINHDTFDNRAENLRWVTHRANCLNRR